MRILVVDDDVMILRGLKRALPRHGFEVRCVETGAEALGCALGGEADVILLDRYLQAEDGLEVCEKLRGFGYAGVIIIMTGDLTTETEIRALELRADDFIRKPLDLPVMVARIRASTRRRSSNVILKIGRLTVDLTARTALVDEVRLDLTDLEFGVLASVAVRPGEVVPWELVVQEVLGAAPDGRPDDGARQGGGLREKMGSARDQLNTVRGAGLRLTGEVDVFGFRPPISFVAGQGSSSNK